jgi:hypothetical protein
MQCGCPMFWGVTIEEGQETADGEGDVGAGCDGNVVEASDQFVIWCVQAPFEYVGIRWDGLVGSSQVEPHNHRRVHRFGIAHIKTKDEAIDVSRLGE